MVEPEAAKRLFVGDCDKLAPRSLPVYFPQPLQEAGVIGKEGPGLVSTQLSAPRTAATNAWACPSGVGSANTRG